MIAAVAQSAEEGQRDFFGWTLALWAVIPFLVVILLARSRRRVEPEPPHVADATFEDLVLRAERPTLVHFYRSWSIGDRVMSQQARRLAKTVAPFADVLWLDVEACPEVMARHPHLETPAFVLYAEGRRVFHAEGVVEEADVVREMRLALEREERLKARAAASSGPAA